MRILSFLLKFFVFFFLALMSVTLPLMILEQEDRWKEFEKHGVEVSGKVVETTHHSTCRPSERICIPIVEFTTKTGEKQRFADYTTATYAGFPIGSTVTVQYLPYHPDTARIKVSSKSQARFTLKARIVLWAVWLFCVVFLVSFIRGYILEPLRNRGKEEAEGTDAAHGED